MGDVISCAAVNRKPGVSGRVWVYVICWRQRGPCKIGVANRPEGRLAGLRDDVSVKGYASKQEAKIAALQRAFERARQGEGLFGLKDAEQRRRGI